MSSLTCNLLQSQRQNPISLHGGDHVQNTQPRYKSFWIKWRIQVSPLLPRRILATEGAQDSSWKMVFLMLVNNILVIGPPTYFATPRSSEACQLHINLLRWHDCIIFDRSHSCSRELFKSESTGIIRIRILR